MIEKLKIFTLLTLLFAGHVWAESSAFMLEATLPNGVDATISVNPYTGESGFVRRALSLRRFKTSRS